MGSRRDAYIEAHSLIFDLENSDCKDCYKKHLECSYYYGECRNEVWMSYKLWWWKKFIGDFEWLIMIVRRLLSYVGGI